MGETVVDYLGGNELIAGEINTEQIPVAADTYYRGMGLAYQVTGASTPGSNTGNGAVTAITATNKAIAGNYVLTVTDATANDTLAVGAVVPGTNTGNGTVTAFAVVAGQSPEVGNFVLKCTDPNAGGTATATAAAGTNTGNGTISAITTGANTKEGVYVVRCHTAVSNGGIFSVVDPDGVRLGDLTVGAAYSNGHLGMTISDGATDFVVGDLFNITAVIANGSKFRLTDPNGVVLSESIQLPGTPGGTVAVVSGGISFTITDGSTDFALNDSFTLPITGANGGVFKLVDPNGVILEDNIRLPGTALGYVDYVGEKLSFRITDGSTDFVVGDSFTLAIAGAGVYQYTTDISRIVAIYNGIDGQVYSAPGYAYAILSGELYEAGLKTDVNGSITLTVGQRQQYADRGFYVRPR